MSIFFIVGSMAVFMGIACNQPIAVKGPPGYNFSQPELIKMPEALREISGIAFNNGNPDTMYAVQDEEGELFYFSPATIDVQQSHFAKKGDYEDIAICKGYILVLRSDGTIFSFLLPQIAGADVENVQEQKGLLAKEEYEAMFADDGTGEVAVLCKSCTADNAKAITGYQLQTGPSGLLTYRSSFTITNKQIAAATGEKKTSFRPSALAKNKRTNEWFILSSVNKLLLVTDSIFKVKTVYLLDASLFAQPEGIAFDSNYNLYISNERGSAKSATVLKFVYKK